MIQTIDEIIERELKKLEDTRSKIRSNRAFIKLEFEKFKEIMVLNINRIIAERGIFSHYEENENSEYILNQLYFHATGNEDKFNGKVTKGIMLVGKNGVGKTLLLTAYCNFRSIFWGSRINSLNSRLLVLSIKENGYDNYTKRDLMIDDLGKESKELNDFGNKIQPISDLLAFRYDSGALTFITCNYNMNTLTEFYGLTTTDRLKEMVNIIEFKGESLRN